MIKAMKRNDEHKFTFSQKLSAHRFPFFMSICSWCCVEIREDKFGNVNPYIAKHDYSHGNYIGLN